MFPILPNSPVETFVHSKTTGEFKQLPSIYAIESTAACDLACPNCLRTTHMSEKHPSLLKMDLLELMLKRGDFAGSSFIELQCAGEPTINPQLYDIIRFLKYDVGVLVGLSTHGLNMRKEVKGAKRKGIFTITDVLLQLDALTISVDSVDPDLYHKMRYPAKLNDLLESLNYFFDAASEADHLPFIELQLVVSDGFKGSGNVKELERVMQGFDWDQYASIRTTNDCFAEMQERVPQGSQVRNSELCINPFTTVNISQDGDVVSCCYIFDTNKQSRNYYGNLYEQSLADIWQGPKVAAMRKDHISGELKDSCTRCMYKSPELIHSNIVSRLVRSQRKQL